MLTNEQLDITNFRQDIFQFWGQLNISKIFYLDEKFFSDQRIKYWLSYNSLYYQGSICDLPLQKIRIYFNRLYPVKIIVRHFTLDLDSMKRLHEGDKMCESSFPSVYDFKNLNIKFFLGKTVISNLNYCGSMDNSSLTSMLISDYLSSKDGYEHYASLSDINNPYVKRLQSIERRLEKLRCKPKIC